MDKKRVSVLFGGVILVLISVIFLSNVNQKITSNVIINSPCSPEGSQGCNGEIVVSCINGNWTDLGVIPGPEGCSPEDNTGGNNNVGGSDNTNDTESGSSIVAVIIIIIILLIIIVGGIIIYVMIKNKNSKPSSHPVRPIFPGNKPMLPPNFPRSMVPIKK